MRRTWVALGGVFCLAFAAGEASSETLAEAFQRISVAAAEAQRTRTRSEFTGKNIPVQVGACSEPRFFRDTLERQRVAMDFNATLCKEKVSFEERQDGFEGRGLFKRPKWTRVPGTERTSYEYADEREDFELSYSPDSFRTSEMILRDLGDACQGRRAQLSARMRDERGDVRCR